MLRKDAVEVVEQGLRKSESLDYGEDHGCDGHDRHQRVERERCAAHQRAVLDQPARRVEQQAVLLHGPPHRGVAVALGVLADGGLRDECRYASDSFHILVRRMCGA